MRPVRRPATRVATFLLAGALLAGAPIGAADAQEGARTQTFSGCGTPGCFTVQLRFTPWPSPSLPNGQPAPSGTLGLDAIVQAVLSPGHALSSYVQGTISAPYLSVGYTGTSLWREPGTFWISPGFCDPDRFLATELSCTEQFTQQWAVGSDFQVSSVSIRYIAGPVGAFTVPTNGPGITTGTLTLSAVPEPATVALLATGLAGVGLLARRRRTG